MGLVRKFFMPNSYVQSIFQIDLDKLVDKGVKGIITDLDNTLVGWDVKEPTERVKAWFKEANEKGITITIVSNNNESRVASFSQHLDIDFIFKARKPMGKAFDKAITKMNIRPDQTVVIGDKCLLMYLVVIVEVYIQLWLFQLNELMALLLRLID